MSLVIYVGHLVDLFVR